MTPEKRPTAKMIAACLILMLGIALLIYCIVAEDEPGGVSLLFILIGATWLIVQRVQHSRKATKI